MSATKSPVKRTLARQNILSSSSRVNEYVKSRTRILRGCYIAALRDTGLSIAEIGELNGITPSRVQHIMSWYARYRRNVDEVEARNQVFDSKYVRFVKTRS